MKDLLLLVASALGNRPLSGPDFDRLCRWTVADWKQILEEAKVQSVQGLVYHAVCLLPPGTPVPEEVLFLLVAKAESIAKKGRSMMAAARSLTERMARLGLHPRVIKGEETARFYPDPSLRSYGDIDLFLPGDEFEDAVASIRAEGYDVRKDTDGSFHFEFEGVNVDMHARFYDLSCPPERLPGPFTPEGILLMLSAHAMKHAVGVGVGLRQLCDAAAAFRFLDGKYDPEAYLAACRKAGIIPWTRLLHRFLEVYLGVPDRVFPENGVSPEPLLKLIREGGNFGHYGAGRLQAMERSPLLRKADTVFRFLRHLPFSLRYAPRETMARIRELIRGNR